MQRTQAAKVQIRFQIEIWKSELGRDKYTDQKANDTPEDRCDHAVADRSVHIGGLIDLFWRKAIIGVPHQQNGEDGKCSEQNPHMGSEQLIMRKSGQKHGKKCSQTRKDCSSGVVHLIPSQRKSEAVEVKTAIAIVLYRLSAKGCH
ncbi:hypothetical protein D9M72_593440 [compost metagenome]